MGCQPVRVLLIEDSESDYLLTRHLLASIENQIFDLEWASSWQMGIEAIRRAGHDICLLDYRIGGGNGLELLRETRAVSQHLPVILLTGVSDYRLDVEAMQIGAADFLLKDELTPALLERSRSEERRVGKEWRFRRFKRRRVEKETRVSIKL